MNLDKNAFILSILIISTFIAVVYFTYIKIKRKKVNTAEMYKYRDFLVLDSNDGRHIVVLRQSFVQSIMKENRTDTFNETAAILAGQLYAGRSGNAVKKTDVLASGIEVAKKARISRFSKASELLRNIEVPSDWDEPVVSVWWKAP